MSEQRKSVLVTTSNITHTLLTERWVLVTDDELVRGRELERIAQQKKLEWGFADADVENYYAAFVGRENDEVNLSRTLEFIQKTVGLRRSEKHPGEPPRTETP